MYNPQDSINVAYTHIRNLRAGGHSYGGYPVYNVTKDDLAALKKITDKYGIPFEWMINLINFESGRTFNPAIQNSIGATGLIQFMGSTATGLGTTTDALRKMTFKQQLVYLDKYLYSALKRHLTLLGTIPGDFTQGDLFMTIFYPVSVGKPDYVFPENVQRANAGIAKPQDYTKKALNTAVFPLSTVPYSLPEFQKKFGGVGGIAEKSVAFVKHNTALFVIGLLLIITAILLFVFRKKASAYVVSAT